MKNYILLLFTLILSTAFTTSCSKDKDENSPEPSFINGKNFLYAGIPDKYNTGCDEQTSFYKLENDGLANQVFIKLRRDDNNKLTEYIITSYSDNLDNLPNETTIENYDFSDANMTIISPDRYSSNKKIIFKNCKFKAFGNRKPYDDNKVSVYFENCTFNGGVNEVNISLNRCKIGGFIGDAMNPLKNFECKNSYICDLLPSANVSGTHIDGFQIYGREGIKGGNIKFDNVRFEIPSIHYDGYSDCVNACVMFQLEFGDVDNCTFQNLICNGGGKWFPIYLSRGKPADKHSQKNLVLKNVKVSDNFGTIFYSGSYDENAIVTNVEHFSQLYISSVIIDNENKTHIICTNDTHLDKTLIIKTDDDEYSFEIPHCPSNWALNGEIDGKVNPNESLSDIKGKKYTKYRFSDMPFDIDCVIDKPCSSIICYDGGDEILNLK
ncbi:MAG: hypothetical protein MJ211_14765 [Bacteroidales bacterium]|nr:hypothetical protein [Bacteroidales bacterium]